VDGDGDFDVVMGTMWAPNRLYLNNGTSAPFSGVSGTDISGDAHLTSSVALGDADNDGDLDVVAGNRHQANRLYLEALANQSLMKTLGRIDPEIIECPRNTG
jgi:hypothetical protein